MRGNSQKPYVINSHKKHCFYTHVMDSTNAPAPNPIVQTPTQFVDFFRSVAPYIHAFRGETFVIAFGGELVQAGKLNALVQDLSLIHALGIKLVIVHGSRPQVNEQLRLKGLEAKFVGANRITDAAALECAKEAAGEIRLDLEALFSQGLPNTAMQNARVRVISGNFVTARPVGVVDGVDFMHTGFVLSLIHI
jgi:amino-acid N-acetyltransferase